MKNKNAEELIRLGYLLAQYDDLRTKIVDGEIIESDYWTEVRIDWKDQIKDLATRLQNYSIVQEILEPRDLFPDLKKKVAH